METRVTYRTTSDTQERLRELAEKYGISQSALLTMLVNERWLAEKRTGLPAGKIMQANGVPEPPPNFSPDDPTFSNFQKARKRHKSKKG